MQMKIMYTEQQAKLSLG